jgi:hypothetical protein
VKAPPPDLDTAVLRVLDHQWGIRATALLYVPLGFGDHHWQAVSDEQRYFVTVRDLRLEGRARDHSQAVRQLEATSIIREAPPDCYALFREVVSRVCLGEVGAIFGLEVARLARNNADFARLLELARLTDTLVIDTDGMYDLREFNDRL